MTSVAFRLSRNLPAVAALTKNERLVSAAIVCVVAIGITVLYFFDPARPGVYPTCLFNALTGLYCPGCGSLRALHQLLHLNLAAALRLNPVLVFTMPFLGYAFVSRVFVGLRGRALPGVFIPAIWIWALFAVVLAFWILRNVPFPPFSSLAPMG